MIDAENSEKLALVLDDHAGAELCRFDAAHFFLRPPSGRQLPGEFADFGNSGGRTKVRSYDPRGMTRGTLEGKTSPTRNHSINARACHGQSFSIPGRHSGIVNVNQAPSTLCFLIELSFPAVGCEGRAISSELGGEIPIKLSPGRVPVNMNGNVVNAQFALRERIAHQVRVDILLDLLEPVLVAQRVDERDIRRIQPDLGGENGVCTINRFRIFLDQASDGNAVG